MKAPKCQSCKRYHFGPICEPNLRTVAQAQVKVHRMLDSLDDSVTRTVTAVTPDATTQYVRVGPLPGHPCPTCGQLVPKHKTNAERQRAYRERVKAK